MNNPGSTICTFNCFELKYLITLQQAEQFKAALRPYLVPNENGSGNSRYALTSLYCDSPDLRCYREKEYGLRFRCKLRIRRYETDEPLTEDSPVCVEIKQHIDRVTQKCRVVLSYGDALRLCNDRQALVGSEYDIGLRVTFDTEISFQTQFLHLHEAASYLPVIPPNQP
jgi:hypothetical protein